MTDADRASMEQCKVDAQQSAAAAVEAAAKAQEHADSIDTARIDASIALKGDSLYYDREAKMLYLTSNGAKIGEGIPITANINNAVLTLENTAGWTSKTIPIDSDCRISFNWSSVEDGVSTGSGTVVVKVAGELQYTSKVDQGEYTLDISEYLILGYNLVHVTVTDVYGNSATITLGITMYDPAALKSTKLVERTLTGNYTNDRVTSVGENAFSGLDTGAHITLPNATTMGVYSFGGANLVVNLPQLTAIPYAGFRYSGAHMVVVPKVKTVGEYGFGNCSIKYADFTELQSITNSRGAPKNVIIRNTSQVPTASNFEPSEYLYVPGDMVEAYKNATNWSAVADRIRVLEAYTVDGTVTGELDFDKMEGGGS